MEDLDDYFKENNTKTSPVHRPQCDIDFPFSDLCIQSPISAPSYEANHINNPRTADIEFNANPIGFIEKPIEIPKKKKKKVRLLPQLYKPFISFEATELTVHQLRSIIIRK